MDLRLINGISIYAINGFIHKWFQLILDIILKYLFSMYSGSHELLPQKGTK